MASPSAITVLFLLVLIPFATAAPSAAPSVSPSAAPSAAPPAAPPAALSVAPSTSSSVGFSGISEHEAAVKKCDIVINGGCTDKKCCLHLCKMRIPYAKTIEVSLKVVNGAHRCLCHATYGGTPGSCGP